MKQAHVRGTHSIVAMDGHLGRPAYDRRLTDKILAAFNHAYAIGERDIAKGLRTMLRKIEDRQTQAPSKRRASSALGQADLWIAFVEARDGYRTACECKASDPAVVSEALEEMKEAYKTWSFS